MLLLFGVYAGVIWLASCDIYLTVLDDFCNDLCMEACVFPQQQNFAMVSLFSQISSGAIRCSFNARFWARFRRVPEGSGADTC